SKSSQHHLSPPAEPFSCAHTEIGERLSYSQDSPEVVLLLRRHVVVVTVAALRIDLAPVLLQFAQVALGAGVDELPDPGTPGVGASGRVLTACLSKQLQKRYEELRLPVREFAR